VQDDSQEPPLSSGEFMARTRLTPKALRIYDPIGPRVVQKALERAGTHVCEPMVRLKVESPSDTIGNVLQAIAQLGGSIAQTQVRGALSSVEARLPADRSRDLQKQLVGLTSGEGSLEADFDDYPPVQGRPPERSSISRRPAP
jgi:ribosomal protection tetracycline resistance protein